MDEGDILQTNISQRFNCSCCGQNRQSHFTANSMLGGLVVGLFCQNPPRAVDDTNLDDSESFLDADVTYPTYWGQTRSQPNPFWCIIPFQKNIDLWSGFLVAVDWIRI